MIKWQHLLKQNRKAQDSLNDNTTKTMTSDKPEDNQPK